MASARATGSTGTPASMATRNAPSWNAFTRASFERVPSAKNITEQRCASTSCKRVLARHAPASVQPFALRWRAEAQARIEELEEDVQSQAARVSQLRGVEVN